jgi:sulfur carrier protein
MNASITLNGSPYPIAGEMPLATLLEKLGLAGKPVVVELDGRAILPREHAETMVRDGIRIEIVTLAAGG